MQQLIYFLQKYKYFLYFLFLEIAAVALIINNHSFHKSKFINSANVISGDLLDRANNISQYLQLKTENDILLQENTILKNKLEQLYTAIDTSQLKTVIDSIQYKQKYQYISGKIIDNNYHTPYNFITINRGKNENVSHEMAVVNSKGIIGITENVSGNYARVQSILNKNSKINARLKNSRHFGTLEWNGENIHIVQLSDIPRQTVLTIGDTIITGGKSSIFPEGLPIGTVESIPEKISAINTIEIKLFNDMTNIGSVNIITNFHKTEINELNKQNE
ncbi:rod shape-determining protein MreC [Tenacibaculum sp. MAR_2009_124]|uniref:rod shape-determining protein MreC n=1 Tax=Tenacibaculum sp. MAR_2009_124 TaxID=1250059 RepID=UPI00089A85BB|nr:rod shape-determining protein MreC [Tenacibaculum sp. MAR_2009_124]SEB67412.1 rod shape-determining protein MreC [Tenacibaculum sp. MAR_2009_124]